ncbi:MAG: PRC-barrel domain-containing protein [Mesorhizobium sp.]|nr:PRC-barrel domain-containing protein [Mesorhizobium sp.]
MIRKLLATTAILTIVSTGAFAQATTNEPVQATPPAATETAPAATAGSPVAEATVTGEGNLASNIIGETVYNGTGDDASNVGDVNDLVISANGQVEAIVIGVGGFLGIGEKNVAVDYSAIDWAERNGDRWIVIGATADQLKELPDFDRSRYAPAPVASADPATAPAPSSTMAANEPAPAAEAPAVTTEAPAATTDATETAAIDRSTLKPVDTAAIRSEEFVGTTVYGANDENLGEIGDVVLSQDGKVEAVLIDVGGFLGVGEKEVAVGMENLSFLADEDGDKYLYTAFTKEQLDAAPAYDQTTYAEKRDEMRLVVPN